MPPQRPGAGARLVSAWLVERAARTRPPAAAARAPGRPGRRAIVGPRKGQLACAGAQPPDATLVSCGGCASSRSWDSPRSPRHAEPERRWTAGARRASTAPWPTPGARTPERRTPARSRIGTARHGRGPRASARWNRTASVSTRGAMASSAAAAWPDAGSVSPRAATDGDPSAPARCATTCAARGLAVALAARSRMRRGS